MNEFAEEKIDNITCDSFNFQESLADIDITEAIVSLVDRSIAINRHLKFAGQRNQNLVSP